MINRRKEYRVFLLDSNRMKYIKGDIVQFVANKHQRVGTVKFVKAVPETAGEEYILIDNKGIYFKHVSKDQIKRLLYRHNSIYDMKKPDLIPFDDNTFFFNVAVKPYIIETLKKLQFGGEKNRLLKINDDLYYYICGKIEFAISFEGLSGVYSYIRFLCDDHKTSQKDINAIKAKCKDMDVSGELGFITDKEFKSVRIRHRSSEYKNFLEMITQNEQDKADVAFIEIKRTVIAEISDFLTVFMTVEKA